MHESKSCAFPLGDSPIFKSRGNNAIIVITLLPLIEEKTICTKYRRNLIAIFDLLLPHTKPVAWRSTINMFPYLYAALGIAVKNTRFFAFYSLEALAAHSES